MRRARDKKLHAGDAGLNELCRRRQLEQDARHFVGTAAGKDRDGRRAGLQSAGREKDVARRRGLREIDQRMPDEFHGNVAVAIDRLLERKDHKHAIRDLLDRLEPLRPPRPDLRADVVDHRHAEPANQRREPEVEIRKIDQHERVRTRALRLGDELAARGDRSGQLGEGFGQAGDGEIAIVVDEAAARRRELRATKAGDGNVRIDRAQLARQRAGVEIAGRLAAREEQARAQDAGRLNSAGSTGELILTSVTVRCTARSPTCRVAL